MYSRTVFTVVGAATLLMGLHMTFRNGDSRDVESPTVAEAPGFRQSDGDRGEHHEGIAALREEISYLRAELSALRQPAVIEEIDALKVQVAALQQRVTGESVAEPVTASDNDTAERGNNELDAAEWMSAAHAKQHTVDQKWVLDAAFDAETTDDDWSTEVRQALHQAFGSQELSDASIHSAECRSTLCRVAVEHKDTTQTGEFELWFGKQLAAVLPRFSLFQEEVDGSAITVVYLARHGHRLPNFGD